MTSAQSVLVVGASGILAPAAAALCSRGVAVTGIGRHRPLPEGVQGRHVDARDAERLEAVFGPRRWSAALVYRPAVSAASLRWIADAVDGTVVVVRTSAAADPAHGELDLPDATVQLGWAGDTGTPRWHTPREVSDAALAVLGDGRARVLGRVRPWEQRP